MEFYLLSYLCGKPLSSALSPLQPGPNIMLHQVCNRSFQHLPLLLPVFAYVVLGVGKSHTMVGSNTSPGTVHLELHKSLKAMKDKSCEVLVSYQQVCCGPACPLLPQGPQGRDLGLIQSL